MEVGADATAPPRLSQARSRYRRLRSAVGIGRCHVVHNHLAGDQHRRADLDTGTYMDSRTGLHSVPGTDVDT